MSLRVEDTQRYLLDRIEQLENQLEIACEGLEFYAANMHQKNILNTQCFDIDTEGKTGNVARNTLVRIVRECDK